MNELIICFNPCVQRFEFIAFITLSVTTQRHMCAATWDKRFFGQSMRTHIDKRYVQRSPALLPASTQSPTLTPPTPAPITSRRPSHRSLNTFLISSIRSRCPGMRVGMHSSFRQTFQKTGSGSRLCKCSSRFLMMKGRETLSDTGEGYGPPIIMVNFVSCVEVSCAWREQESKTVPRIPGTV
jgi:hypothetical protein